MRTLEKKHTRWFGDILNKKSHIFFAFDVCDIYPSITEEQLLLDKAVEFASQYIEITTDEMMIIKHTKRPLSIDGA